MKACLLTTSFYRTKTVSLADDDGLRGTGRVDGDIEVGLKVEALQVHLDVVLSDAALEDLPVGRSVTRARHHQNSEDVGADELSVEAEDGAGGLWNAVVDPVHICNWVERRLWAGNTATVSPFIASCRLKYRMSNSI